MYETLTQSPSVSGAAPHAAAGAAIVYAVGLRLIVSVNGFLMPLDQINNAGAISSIDDDVGAAESKVLATDNSSTVLAILKMAPDATQNELVYDQRI